VSAVPTRTWIVELSKDTCEELLRATAIGRLAVIIDGRPQVFPVCHVFDGGALIVPTNDSTKMHAALSWPAVGFEVDGIDGDGQSGWSVMVQGRAEEVTDPSVIQRAMELQTVAFRLGEHVRWVRIVPTEITGRRIHAGTPHVR
jgi:nitroimidazol reductase NimA-like FMN-containing flavoprotein (pyridoxamine 5'-phosphate oxidase superfamily)